MKSVYLILSVCLLAVSLHAQRLKPYLAVVKTKTDKQKGILQKVDSVSVVLNVDGELVRIKNENIKSISIRSVKSNYKGINLIKIGSDEEYHFNASGKYVDKFGKAAPSIKDELGASFFSVIFTGIANGLVWPIHQINPNLARFNFREKPDLTTLSYYSVYYQNNPNILAELDQLKKISSSSKP